jgi:hypothetical protein
MKIDSLKMAVLIAVALLAVKEAVASSNAAMDITISGDTARIMFEQLLDPVARSQGFSVNGVNQGEMRFGRQVTCTHWTVLRTYDCQFILETNGEIKN